MPAANIDASNIDASNIDASGANAPSENSNGPTTKTGFGSNESEGRGSDKSLRATRCTLRVSKKGIYVDGNPVSRTAAVSACKQRIGAMVVLEDDAPPEQWNALKAGLRQARVPILMRGVLDDNDCMTDPLAKGCL